MHTVPTSNWLFICISANSIVIITLTSRYKRVESNLVADEKGPQDRGQVVVWVIHLKSSYLLAQATSCGLQQTMFQAREDFNLSLKLAFFIFYWSNNSIFLPFKPTSPYFYLTLPRQVKIYFTCLLFKYSKASSPLSSRATPCVIASLSSTMVATLPGRPGTPRWVSLPCQNRRAKPFTNPEIHIQ